ncbi:MAG: PTS fructose transporter subunit IIA [Desulfococcus sp. 4484_241]|nr:MAG: PTS fructose transporter subunit IIA [Desulfococcus sp. 4484_241]
MIGILIVTHGNLGDALIDTAELVLGSRPEKVAAVSIDITEPAEKLRKKIADGIKAMNEDDGVLIMTDLFGGSPSNLSYSFLEEGSIEVISGVNLPILVKAIRARHSMDLSELTKQIEDVGKKSISIASSILKGNKRS